MSRQLIKGSCIHKAGSEEIRLEYVGYVHTDEPVDSVFRYAVDVVNEAVWNGMNVQPLMQSMFPAADFDETITADMRAKDTFGYEPETELRMPGFHEFDLIKELGKIFQPIHEKSGLQPAQ